MNDSVELSEELLLKAGGWREMKEARQIHGAGVVSEVRYENGLLEALIPLKGKATKIRLRIHSATDMENHCPCPPARREGIVCAHVLAAGLEAIDPKNPGAAPDGAELAGKNAPAKETAAPGISPAWPIACEDAADEATPAELFVVLPPNFAAAWEKNRIMAGIELESGGQRKLLASARGGERLFFGPRDAALFSALQDFSPGAVPGMMRLGREDFLKLLDALAGHPRVSFGRNDAVRVSITPLRPPARLSGHRFRIDWPQSVAPLVGEHAAWALSGTVFQPVAPGLPERFRPIFEDGYAIDPAESGSAASLLENAFDIGEDTFDRMPRPAAPEIELDLQGSLNRLAARLSFRYGPEKFAASHPGAPRFVEAGERTLVTRPLLEQRAVAELGKFGFGEPDADGKQALKDRNAILRFFAHGFPKLDPGWKITTGPDSITPPRRWNRSPRCSIFKKAAKTGSKWGWNSNPQAPDRSPAPRFEA